MCECVPNNVNDVIFKLLIFCMSEIKVGAILNYTRLFVSLGVGFFLSPFVLASLGKAEYGIYTIAGTIISWLALCDFGLSASTTKFLSEYQANGDKEGEAHYLGNVAALFSIIGAVVLIVGLCIYPALDIIFPRFSEEELKLYRILYLMTLFNTAIMFPGRSIEGIAVSRQRFKVPGIVNNVMSIGSATCTLIVLLLGYKSIALCSVSIAFGLMGMIWNVFFCFKILGAKMTWNGWDVALCKSMFTVSIWMFLQQLVSSFNFNCGSMIVGSSAGSAEVSIYSYGHVLMNYFLLLSSCMGGLFLPKIIKIVQNPESPVSTLADLMVRVGRYQLIILLLPLLGLIFTGHEFFELWIGKTMGSDTEESWLIATMMSVALFPILVQSLGWQIMIAKNLLKHQVKVTIFSSLCMVILGYILTNMYGAIGMSVSSVGASLISFLSLAHLYSRRIGLPMRQVYAEIYKGVYMPVIVASVLMCCVQYLLNSYSGWFVFFVRVGFLSIIYILLMSYFYFNKEEKVVILSPLKRVFKRHF